jgi:hypothetical protein
MALARVMCEVNPENRLILKPEGLLTDPRMVERKKFGQKKARKKFQLETLILPVLKICIQDSLSLLLNLKQCCCCPVEAGISLASKCI